jgi:PAS domain S-box-containing protein
MRVRQRLLDTAWSAPATADESDRLRLLVHSVGEYAIFLLAPDGTVMTWNPGAERLKGYAGPDIVGRHFGVFYPPDDGAAGKPERELADAVRDGVFVGSGWRVGSDGTRFWAHVVITALYDGPVLRGFAKVTRDDTAARAAMEGGRAIADITRALLVRANVTDVLAMVTAHTRHLTGAGRAWLATPRETGFIVRAADGQVPGPLVGSELPSDPVIADVLRAGRPVFLNDLRASCPKLPGIDQLGAALLVPMVAGTAVTGTAQTGVIGILVSAAPAGASPFRPLDLELLQAFANQAELVLSYELAQQALRERQLSDDRERIARDLHDHVIQQLFGTGIGLQNAAGHTEDAGVRGLIDEAVDRLDTTIRQIRTTIFDLHQQDPSAPATVRTQIADLVRDAARALTFRPALRLEGAIDTLIESSTGEHLLAALREMLSNVARHAKASAATVSVIVGSDVILRVADNGSGPQKDVPTGSGLGNLRARADLLNGSFALDAAPHRGAVATLRIPLPQPQRPR